MSLDIYLMKSKKIEYCSFNITHNLTTMAKHVLIPPFFRTIINNNKNTSLYKYLWYPEDINLQSSSDLVYPLIQGLRTLHARPNVYRKYNPENGWGSYESFIVFLEKLLLACIKYPKAKIEISR